LVGSFLGSSKLGWLMQFLILLHVQHEFDGELQRDGMLLLMSSGRALIQESGHGASMVDGSSSSMEDMEQCQT
jgi:hypothetical protein